MYYKNVHNSHNLNNYIKLRYNPDLTINDLYFI